MAEGPAGDVVVGDERKLVDVKVFGGFVALDTFVPVPDGRPDAEGVVGADPVIAGRDSSKEAPKEDDGLKGLRPAKPVR